MNATDQLDICSRTLADINRNLDDTVFGKDSLLNRALTADDFGVAAEVGLAVLQGLRRGNNCRGTSTIKTVSTYSSKDLNYYRCVFGLALTRYRRFYFLDFYQ